MPLEEFESIYIFIANSPHQYSQCFDFSVFTGFIPRGQHYFGNRYAIICKGAISDFENDHQLYKNNANELKLTEAVQSGKIDKSQVPNLPVSYKCNTISYEACNFGLCKQLKHYYDVGQYVHMCLRDNVLAST